MHHRREPLPTGAFGNWSVVSQIRSVGHWRLPVFLEMSPMEREGPLRRAGTGLECRERGPQPTEPSSVSSTGARNLSSTPTPTAITWGPHAHTAASVDRPGDQGPRTAGPRVQQCRDRRPAVPGRRNGSRPTSAHCSTSSGCETGCTATIVAYESGLIRPGVPDTATPG